MEIDRSSLIVSKAGRDKGQLFFVIDADEQYVYLADGKSRKLEKPKRKKRRHVQAAFQTESRIAEKIRNGEKVLNSELRKEGNSLINILRDIFRRTQLFTNSFDQIPLRRDDLRICCIKLRHIVI